MGALPCDVGVEDDEVDRSNHERMQAAIQGFERPAAVAGFYHVISCCRTIYTTGARRNRFRRIERPSRRVFTRREYTRLEVARFVGETEARKFFVTGSGGCP